MKKTNLKLPHIPRIITAVTALYAKKLSHLISHINPVYVAFTHKYIPLFAVLLFFLFTLIYPLNDLERARNRILANPKNYQNHLLLSELFNRNFDADGALKEALIAESLNDNPESFHQVKKIEKIRNRPQEIKNRINYGLIITSSYGDYRDAYLTLASLSFQLKELNSADYYVNRALELDPNHELTDKLKVLLAGQE